MRTALIALGIATLIVLAGCAGGGDGGGDIGGAGGGDGGVGDGSGMDGGGLGDGGGGDGGVAAGDGGDGGERVGAAVGGAQDANAFRANVREGYVPQPTDLTYEGLFHDYYFDTGSDEACEARFCPSHSAAVTRDPLSNHTERFVTVGLNSGLTSADLQRKPLDIVVVLDTSGSMGERFDSYYYDGGEKKQVEENTRKIEAAHEAVVSMLGHLGERDRVAVVGYDGEASVIRDLRRLSEIDRADLRSDVRNLNADGGTNLDAGMRAARRLAADSADNTERETRVIYVTDAMPNLGETAGESLQSRLSGHAQTGIHSTFVGVGVDFNSRLTERIATVRGANYYSVHSPAQFDRRMDEGFSYMVTPLAYNLTLRVEGEGYEIDTVYGSPQAEGSSARLMQVNTLFPSRREGNRTEGGVVLLEVERERADATFRVTTSYERPDGTRREVTRTVGFDRHDPPYYGSTGVRKAVALAEYGSLLRGWMAHERTVASGEDPEPPSGGIERRPLGGDWEQTSVDLQVSPPYDDRIDRFVPYFRRQVADLGAERMRRDLAILRRLANASDAGTGGVAPDSTRPLTATSAETPAGEESDGDGASRAGVVVGFLGGRLPLVGLVNLVVTLWLATYALKRRQRSRDGTGGRGR